MPDLPDAAVGQELPSIDRRPTTRDLARFTHAANDYAPLHYDRDCARSSGFSTVVVHGARTAAYMSQVLTEWAGDRGWVTDFRSADRAFDVPGDLLTARGRVAAVRRQENALPVHVELWFEDDAGGTTTRGRGEALFVDDPTDDGHP
jgi:acyl dehydratase